MALRDFIVPKWKHSRKEVRLAALGAVARDPAILVEIARTDESPEVRIAAIQRIDDEQQLNSIIESAPDEQVKIAASKRREALFEKIIATSADPSVVVAVLEKYDNEKVTAAYLCEHQLDGALQTTLLQKVKSPVLLCKIVEHGCALEAGESIVERIAEKELLERIARKASNKKIRLLAQKRLEALFPDPLKQQRVINAALEQCCRAMDMPVSLRNLDQGVLLLEEARKLWAAYDPERTHPLAEKFVGLERVMAERIERAGLQKTTLETLASLARQAEALSAEAADGAEEKLAQLQAQWDGTDQSMLSGGEYQAIAGRFAEETAAVRNRILASREEHERQMRKNEAFERCCEELEVMVSDNAAADAKRHARIQSTWDSLCLDSPGPSPASRQRFAEGQKKYREKLAAAEEQKQAAAQQEADYVLSLLQRMETISQAQPHQLGALRQEAVNLKREWEKRYPLAGAKKRELESAFSQAYEQFMSSYHESREQSEWQQWASENVKAKILAEIEQFENRLQQGESPLHLARKVRVFEEQWRQARGADREKSKELDSCFTDACTRIFTLGMVKKSELLETLKGCLASDDGSDVAERVKGLQKQWNDIGYLPAEIEGESAESFASLCNAFFEQRRERFQEHTAELEKNIALREQICTKAQQWATSTDWKAARQAFEELQKEWDESWPAPMKRSRELWQIFSKSREQFYEAYDGYRQANDAVKEELCVSAEGLLAQLESRQPVDVPDASVNEDSAAAVDQPAAPSPEVNYGRILHEAIELRKRWRDSGPASRENSEKLWQRFDPALKKIFAAIDAEHSRNFALKEALVTQAEALAGSEEWDQTGQSFAEIREQWKQIRPAARRDEQALWARLQAAGNTFFDRRRAFFEDLKQENRQQLAQFQELAAELETLVRVAGKGHLLKEAQERSAAEILKEGMELRNTLVVDGDPQKTRHNIGRRLEAIVDKLNDLPRLSGREYYQLSQRCRELIGILRAR